MPNTKSAKRKVKKVAKQVLINKFWKRRYKLAIKKMETLLKKPKNKKEILGFHSEFQSELKFREMYKKINHPMYIN